MHLLAQHLGVLTLSLMTVASTGMSSNAATAGTLDLNELNHTTLNHVAGRQSMLDAYEGDDVLQAEWGQTVRTIPTIPVKPDMVAAGVDDFSNGCGSDSEPPPPEEE